MPSLKLWDGFDEISPELYEVVKKLQTTLNDQGYELEVDGLFGYDTEAAVRDFQEQSGIDVDGVVNAATWNALLGK